MELVDMTGVFDEVEGTAYNGFQADKVTVVDTGVPSVPSPPTLDQANHRQWIERLWAGEVLPTRPTPPTGTLTGGRGPTGTQPADDVFAGKAPRPPTQLSAQRL